jgi:peroxiredoxin
VRIGDTPSLQFRAYGTRQQINLADYRGKLVVVHFFLGLGTVSLAEMDYIIEARQKYGGQGLMLLGISCDINQSDMVGLLQRRKIDWPLFYDPMGFQGKIAMEWAVTSTPRVFLLDPAGKVVWIGAPSGLMAAIEKAMVETPPQKVSPRVIAESNRLLDDVESHIKEKRYGQAMKALARVSPDAREDQATASRLETFETALNEYASRMLSEVDGMIGQKQYAQAHARLQDLVTSLAGTAVGLSARDRLDELLSNEDARATLQQADREARATLALRGAERLVEQNRHDAAYARFKSIIADFPGTPAAQTAGDAVTRYEQDAEFMARLQAPPPDTARARSLLSLAQSYQRSGRRDLAKAKFQEVIDQFPGTSEAKQAQQELSRMR